MADGTTPPTDERTDLVDLVRKRMTESGLSQNALAAALIDPENPDAGTVWSRPTLQNFLGGKPVKAPGPGELRALARALDLPLRTVQDAAAGQYFGIDAVYAGPDDEVRVLVAGFADLSPEDRRKIQALIDEFRNG